MPPVPCERDWRDSDSDRIPTGAPERMFGWVRRTLAGHMFMEAASLARIEAPPPTDDSAEAAQIVTWYTCMAVQQGSQWASLCRELGVASCGDTADEALGSLREAIEDLLAFQEEEGSPAGTRMSDRDFAAFLRSHEGGGSVSGLVFGRRPA